MKNVHNETNKIEVTIKFTEDEFNFFKEVATVFFTKGSPVHECPQEWANPYEDDVILPMFNHIHEAIYEVDKSYWWVNQTNKQDICELNIADDELHQTDTK